MVNLGRPSVVGRPILQYFGCTMDADRQEVSRLIEFPGNDQGGGVTAPGRLFPLWVVATANRRVVKSIKG